MADEDRGVSSFDVRDYWEVLRRRKWVVVVAVVVVVVVAMGRSLRQDEVFRAQAEIEVAGDSGESEVDIATEVRVVTSDDVREIAREHLPEGAGEVFASQEAGTEIVRVEAESTDPKVAAATANEYAHAYVEFRRSQRVQRLLEGVGQAEAKLTDVRAQIEALDAEEAAGRELIDDQVDSRAITASEAAERREALEEGITRKRNPFLDQQRVLETMALQAQINGESLTGGAEVIKAAEEPSDPIRPDPVRDLVAALAAGSLLGMVLAFGFEYLDDSINTSDDLSRAIGDLPLLGAIPAVADWKDSSTPEVVTLTYPRSPAAEAYRSLRTALQFVDLDEPLMSLAVTSPMAGEGKTTLVANLGAAIAQSGRSVVMVDCDLRRPRLHAFFGLSNRVGLSSALIGDAKISAAAQAVPGVEGLCLIPSGPTPPNPSDLLSSERFARMLSWLHTSDSLILVDCPPLLPVTDAAIVATLVQRVALVVGAGTTNRKDVRRAVEVLNRVSAPPTGLVLNRVVASEGSDYSYGPADPPMSGLRVDSQRLQTRESRGNGSRANGDGTTSRKQESPRGRRATFRG